MHQWLLYDLRMAAHLEKAIPVLPAIDVAASLRWWCGVCGFTEVFHHGDPPSYAGISRDGVWFHLTKIEPAVLARTVGDQTMLRLQMTELEVFLAEYQACGGTIHPNGGLQRKPWGSLEFTAVDPGGVCVAFFE